jgi:hypothetical protein
MEFFNSDNGKFKFDDHLYFLALLAVSRGFYLLVSVGLVLGLGECWCCVVESIVLFFVGLTVVRVCLCISHSSGIVLICT